MSYTLGQAAKATGLSKPTIANAIKKGRISAQRDDIGQYAIDPAELHRIFPAVNQVEVLGKRANESSQEKSSEILALRGRVEALERLLKELERSRDSAETDKEAWKEEAAHLRKLLVAPPSVIHAPAPEAPPPVFPATVEQAATAKPNRGIFGWLKMRAA